MTNCAHHAKATKLWVSFDEFEERLVLQVRDNGIGIMPERVSGDASLGLFAITERAKHVGGKVSVQGDQGEGTTVSVEIPLQRTRLRKQSRPWNRVCEY